MRDWRLQTSYLFHHLLHRTAASQWKHPLWSALKQGCRPHHLTGPAPSVAKRHRTLGRTVQPRVKGTRPTPRQGAGQRMLGEPTQSSSTTQVPGLPVSRGHGSSHHSDISFCSRLPCGYWPNIKPNERRRKEEEKKRGRKGREQNRKLQNCKSCSLSSPLALKEAGHRYLPPTVFLQFGFISILIQTCVLHLISYVTVLDGN